MLTEYIASVLSRHAGVIARTVKELHCTQNELQVLSAFNPTSNYPRMAGKSDAACPVSIVLGVFVLAIFISA